MLVVFLENFMFVNCIVNIIVPMGERWLWVIEFQTLNNQIIFPGGGIKIRCLSIAISLILSLQATNTKDCM